MFQSAFLSCFLLGLSSSCILIIIISAPTTPTPEITTTATTTTAAPAGRKKRSVTDCGLLEAWENMAFTYCPHGQDGFTWAEVQDCEDTISSFPTYSNISLPFELPTQDNFDAIDANGNNDDVVTMDEWADFVGCD
eukprot:TRINITY_DN6164_c0_g1_i2.p1 TRINITY_DN6164_c0_g1~~TRINITY_DN6164_c0_g1_i2.p1  ORF type:complete len:136 (-),score=29.87 TRINITY_DN6164_c0_g1_i2:62-469(-)